MAYDVTLGGQNFTLDNPQVVLGLLDNLAKIQSAKADEKKKTEQHQKILDTLEKYNISDKDEGPAKSFEELGRRYRGTTGERDADGHPIPKFESERKPQVTNLRQLVDVIQGLKGLPQEYAGALISRLTGIPDQSEKQMEGMLKLRAALSAPEKEAAIEQKKSAQASLEDFRKQQLGLQADKLKEQKFGRIRVLSQALNTTLDPNLKQQLGKMYLKEMMDLLGSEGITPTTPPASGISNFRKVSK